MLREVHIEQLDALLILSLIFCMLEKIRGQYDSGQFLFGLMYCSVFICALLIIEKLMNIFSLQFSTSFIISSCHSKTKTTAYLAI